MPLCTGGSLQHYVFDNKLSIGQIIYIITSIAAGLDKVHTNGYIHRDIKCDNVFLSQDENNIVIGDFGVVSICPTADSSVEEAGVVLFWAPELVNQLVVNSKIDIWALGIVILEILNSGKAPYEDDCLSEEEIKEKIIQTTRPAYPTDLPPLLVDLLDHCLDPNPDSRYSARQILNHQFLACHPQELLFPFNTPPLQPTRQKLLSKAAKCKIPVRSLFLGKVSSSTTSLPVNETILKVYRNRLSLSDQNRSQGSRLPMLRLVEPVIEPSSPKLKQIKEKRPFARSNTMSPAKKQQLSCTKSALQNVCATTVKSSNNSNRTSVKPHGKPVRSPNNSNPTSIKSPTNSDRISVRSPNTIKSSPASNRTLAKSPNTIPIKSPKKMTSVNTEIKPPHTIQRTIKSPNKAKSPIAQTKATPKKAKIDIAAASMPVKESIYRKKKVSSESRTARLTLGISTSRRQSYKTREPSAETNIPTLAHKRNSSVKDVVKKQMNIMNSNVLRVH